MNKKELQNKIEDLEKQLAEVKEQVNSIEDEEIKNCVRWKPERTELYYFIDNDGDILSETWEDYSNEKFRFNTGNCFKTEQEAKDYKENLLTKQALKDLALELNEMERVDWDNYEQWKFYIYFNYSKNQLCTHFHSMGQNLLMIYCLNKDFLTIAKDRIGEEKLIKLIKSGI